MAQTKATKDDGKKKKPFGEIDEGAFHRWLGKAKDAPLTEEDYARGMRSNSPHVRKMAQFAKNSRKFKHVKKDDKKKATTPAKKRAASLEQMTEHVPAFIGW